MLVGYCSMIAGVGRSLFINGAKDPIGYLVIHTQTRDICAIKSSINSAKKWPSETDGDDGVVGGFSQNPCTETSIDVLRRCRTLFVTVWRLF